MTDLAQIGLVHSKGFSSWLIRTITRSHWNHVIVRVSEHTVVSAEPSGVTIMQVGDFPDAVWSRFPLTDRQTAKIIAFNLAQVGKPYGVATYLWIGVALLLRLQTPAWLESRLSDQHTWICSQLADASYQAAGIHLFRDDRPTGAVYPGSLGRLYADFAWTDTP